MRSESEIRKQEGEATAVVCEGTSKVPGMSYEEGVSAALLWATGDSDDLPIDPA